MLPSSLPLRLNRFSNFSTVNLWNSRIRQCVYQSDAQKALFFFRQMKQQGVEPNNLTFPFLSKACAKLSNLGYAQILHTQIMKSSFHLDVFVQTGLIDMYVKCNQVEIAYNVFVKMPKKDIVSWNAILVGFVQSGILDRVFCIFREMRFVGFLPDSVTVMGVSQAISCVENLKWAKGVHSFGIRIGIEPDVSVANTWISMYAKCGDLGLAKLVFDGIEVGLRSVVSWNSMIAGYANFEKFFDALSTYKWMLQDGFMPDISTFVSLLSSCVQPWAIFQGMMIHSHGLRFGCDSSIHVVNTLISMYSKCRYVASARYLFDSMCDRTCVSWTAIISAYAEKGDMDEAMTLFHAMEAAGLKPDLVAVLSVISGCGKTGVLEIGKWIDAYASSHGLKHNIQVCNALIDMYAKCGKVAQARELFYSMPDRTVVSWTTMIAGCALNGLFVEAMELFHQMLELGLKPNHITFLAILQACSHAGFLEKGWECFNMMTEVYKINPGLDHYSCMADLLGRRGKLNEALKFIQDMPIKPDTAIWSGLLGACKIHNNVEIGEFVASKLFELEPHVAVPYVEMANIYASEGRWDGVLRIRTMMKCKKVRKSPGQSLVEVNRKTHTFTVEDRDHFEGEQIYSVLDGLVLHSKEDGYLGHTDRTGQHELELVLSLLCEE